MIFKHQHDERNQASILRNKTTKRLANCTANTVIPKPTYCKLNDLALSLQTVCAQHIGHSEAAALPCGVIG